MGDTKTGRPGALWTMSPGTNWPPLRLTRLRHERESVGVVWPEGVVSGRWWA